MPKRDTSPEAVARHKLRPMVADTALGTAADIAWHARRAERARVRRIVRRIRRTGPMGCVAQMEREVACDTILAALREGKGTKG